MSPDAPDAFFVADADSFIPSVHTRGPWSADHQHGGPPTALLARAVERATALPLARVTVDFLRPVPIAPLRIELELRRPGKRVQIHEATLLHDGRAVARMAALCVTQQPLSFGEPVLPDTRPMADLEAATAIDFPFFPYDVGYHKAMDVRYCAGGVGYGYAEAWMRMRMPLVAGEQPSPWQRVLCAADSGSGVSARLDTDRFAFLNPDLTVYLHRPPVGEWIGLSSVTTPEATGIGIADTHLHDPNGPIGRGTQSLLITSR